MLIANDHVSLFNQSCLSLRALSPLLVHYRVVGTALLLTYKFVDLKYFLVHTVGWKVKSISSHLFE